jgi:WD40 repeat protein
MEYFQVGGSLSQESPSYIKRQADDEIYGQLKANNFCYVLSARQMGKSSLRVRTMKRLEDEGYKCIAIDLSTIGSNYINTEQWYYSFLFQVIRELAIDFDIKEWWKLKSTLPLVKRFVVFFRDVVLAANNKEIVIFVDEIDYILGINKDNFKPDDFFAAIRAHLAIRTEYEELKRLNFVVMGVAIPSDLIADQRKTPFTQGLPIQLGNFTLEEAMPLVSGFTGLETDKTNLLKEILFWTGGQPVLTQKLCKSIEDNELNISDIPLVVKNHVNNLFLGEVAIESEPNLLNVRNRVVGNTSYSPKMLQVYKSILLGQPIFDSNDDLVILYLKLSGIVKVDGTMLKVANTIYESKFNLNWVELSYETIARPFSEEIDKWLINNKLADEAPNEKYRIKACRWLASRTDLSNEETEYFHFLNSFSQKQKTSTKNFRKIAIIAASAIIVLGIVIATILKISNADSEDEDFEDEEVTQVEEQVIEKKNQEAQAKSQNIDNKEDKFLNFLINEFQLKDELLDSDQNSLNDSLLALKTIENARELLKTDPTKAISLVISDYHKNRTKVLGKFLKKVYYTNFFYTILRQDIAKYPRIASGSNNSLIAVDGGYLYVWDYKHKLLLDKQLDLTDYPFKAIMPQISQVFIYNNEQIILRDFTGELKGMHQWGEFPFDNIVVSPDGKYIATTQKGEGLILWTGKGDKIMPIKTSKPITLIKYSPSGKYIFTGDAEYNGQLFDIKGKMIQEFKGNKNWINDVCFSSHEKYLITAADDGNLIWFSIKGKTKKAAKIPGGAVKCLDLDLNDENLVAGCENGNICLLNPAGKILATFRGHTNTVENVIFSERGNYVVSTSKDGTIRKWNMKKAKM